MSILKSKRTEAGKTQEEIASLVGVTTAIYQRIEANADYAAPKVLLRLCKLFNIDMDQIFPDENIDDEQTPTVVGSPYKKIFSRVELLQSYLNDIPVSFDETTQVQVNKVRKTISSVAKKPNLGVMGRSDSGKSHFINTLLGGTSLPEKLQPTTSAVTIVRHLSDKPKDLKSNVIIFKNMAHLDMLDEIAYYDDNSDVLNKGGYDLLSSEIVHNHIENHSSEAYSCVVYVESEILKTCNIIDAPGFANTDSGNGLDSDTSKALSMLTMLDVLVYMSPVTGCMDSTDIISLRSVFKSIPAPEAMNIQLPALSNIFFVTSHAAPHISTSDLVGLRESASARIYNHFYIAPKEGLLEERAEACGQDISSKTLESRWYFFWSSTKDRSERLIADLCEYLSTTMPSIIDKNVDGVIANAKKSSIESVRSALSEADLKLNNYEELLEHYKAKLNPEVMANDLSKIEIIRSELLPMVKNKEQIVINKSNQIIDSCLSPDFIENIIKDRFSDKNEAKAYAYAHIVERIQQKIESVFTQNTTEIESEISDKLQVCTTDLSKMSREASIEIPFDAKGVFSGIGAGATIALSLGAYASTLGSLGGYAVAAQGVGILSSLGLGFSATGGTSGVMAAISTIGGPVVLTGLIAVGVALGIKRLFGSSWQRRLAKQISETIIEKKLSESMIGNIKNEFSDLNGAVVIGCDNLRTGYLAHVELMNNEVENPARTKDTLHEHIDILEEELSFFLQAPWGNP